MNFVRLCVIVVWRTFAPIQEHLFHMYIGGGGAGAKGVARDETETACATPYRKNQRQQQPISHFAMSQKRSQCRSFVYMPST